MTKGTIDNPIAFTDAIQSDRIIPGDVLLLRGGTYAGNWTLNIGGSNGAPVTIKPYNHEPVIFDGGLALTKSYLKIMDVEITNSNPDRTTWIEPGIVMGAAGHELIGCYIHDLHNDGVNWMGGGTGRIAECLIDNNGSNDGQDSFGHAIYTHNDPGGLRTIEHNLLLNQMGAYTIHIYSAGENWLQDYACIDNVIWGDPVHIGGGLGIKNLIYDGNIQCGDYAQIGRYSPEGENYDATIRNNLFIDMSNFRVDPFQSLTESNNIAWSDTAGWTTQTGYTVEAKPSIWSHLVPFSLSERWSGIQCSITDGVFSAEMVSL